MRFLEAIAGLFQLLLLTFDAARSERADRAEEKRKAKAHARSAARDKDLLARFDAHPMKSAGFLPEIKCEACGHQRVWHAMYAHPRCQFRDCTCDALFDAQWQPADEP